MRIEVDSVVDTSYGNRGVVVLATDACVVVRWQVRGADQDIDGSYSREKFEQLVREQRLTLSTPEEGRTT